jgi:hypothetical protein
MMKKAHSFTGISAKTRRTNMPQKYMDLLISLAPLVLIIGVSWFFSYLSARLRKKTEQPVPGDKPEPAKGLVQMFLEEADAAEQSKPGEQRVMAPAPPTASYGQGWQPHSASPQVTSRPIKPRWWGA